MNSENILIQVGKKVFNHLKSEGYLPVENDYKPENDKLEKAIRAVLGTLSDQTMYGLGSDIFEFMCSSLHIDGNDPHKSSVEGGGFGASSEDRDSKKGFEEVAGVFLKALRETFEEKEQR